VTYGAHDGIGPVISASRSVLYAAPGTDFVDAARAAARDLRDQINGLRSS
jgi:hypothetical protein